MADRAERVRDWFVETARLRATEIVEGDGWLGVFDPEHPHSHDGNRVIKWGGDHDPLQLLEACYAGRDLEHRALTAHGHLPAQASLALVNAGYVRQELVLMAADPDELDAAATSARAGDNAARSARGDAANSAREAPATSAREAPSPSAREVPATSAREVPATSAREVPATSAREVPATSAREVPATSAREVPESETVEFGMRLWQAESPELSAEVVAELMDRRKNLTLAAKSRWLVTEVDGEVVGSAQVVTRGSTAELNEVTVDPAHRGHGLGDALLRGAALIARAENCDLLVLEALAADWPRTWYAARGFADVDLTQSFLLHPIPTTR